jgi:hypothetical protein
MSISWTFITIVVVWLTVITGIVIKIWQFFKRLSYDTETENIAKLLENIAKKDIENSRIIEEFTKRIEYFQRQEEIHMQKYGFVRFNPFGDMGGDHSFCLALLNGKNTGFVLTGLHTRERTRVYVKHIKRGKSEYDLSKEEKKALEEALKNRNEIHAK